jgi:mycothiol system anti-sigma-R factor
MDPDGTEKLDGRGPSEPDHEELAQHPECREALDRLYVFLDGELNDERWLQIQHHLDECSPCLEAFDFEAELKVMVATRCREQVPYQLRARVAQAIEAASGTFHGSEDGAGTQQPFSAS